MALWNINIHVGVNGKILKCAISWKRLIVERNGRKIGTRRTTVHIGRVLLMPDSWSLVWGHSMHFAKFPRLRFSKGYCSPSFHSISTKFYCNYVGHEGIQGVTVFGDLPKFKKNMALWNFVNTEPYRAGNFKRLLLQILSDMGQCYDKYGSHRGI